MGMEKTPDEAVKPPDPAPADLPTRRSWTNAVLVAAIALLLFGWYVYRAQRLAGGVSRVMGDMAEPAALTKAGSARSLQYSYHDIIDTIKPAVISIDAIGQDPNANAGDPTTNYTRIGSGVIIDPRGYALSSLHVVDGASSLKATVYSPVGAREYPVKVVKGDRTSDLVLLLLQAGETLPHADLGDSNAVRTGDVVLSIGSPFGFEQSVTSGIVSSRNRTLQVGGVVYENLIQTDSSINKGSSGGPLVNTKGNVIGINTAVYALNQVNTGISFAVPINRSLSLVGGVVNFLNQPPPLAAGQLAAMSRSGRQIGNAFRLPSGQVLTPPHAFRGECADCHPQISSGQLVALNQNGRQLGNTFQLPSGKVFTPPHDFRGSCICCHPEVLRGSAPQNPNKRQAVNQVWGWQPGCPVVGPADLSLGITVGDVDAAVARQNNMIQTGGAYVLCVNPGSAADISGLQPGDVIIRIDGRKIQDSNIFNRYLQSMTGNGFDLEILRFGVRRVVSISMVTAAAPQAVAGNINPTPFAQNT